LPGKIKVTVTNISFWIRRSMVNVCFYSLRLLKLLLFGDTNLGEKLAHNLFFTYNCCSCNS